VLVEPTAAQADVTAANLLRTMVCEAVSERGVCHLALAGGTTPRALYQDLARQAAQGDVPWHRTEVFFGDEHDVPQDHVDSIYNMVQRTLLDHVPIPPNRVHPMPGDAADPVSAAAEYEVTIRRIVPVEDGTIPRFDLILLGMGGDGHTASLFPGTDALRERKKLVTACLVPRLGRNRMTLTFPLLNAARNLIMLITGEDKAPAVSALLSDDPEARRKIPAAQIKPVSGKLYIVLDVAAAKLIEPKQA